MILEIGDRVAGIGMAIESLGEEDHRADIHICPPEAADQLALDFDVFDVARILGRRDRRDTCSQGDTNRPSRRRIDPHLCGRAVEIARGQVPLLPFPLIHGHLDDVPVGTVKGRIDMENGLNVILSPRNQVDVLQRESQSRACRSRPADRAPIPRHRRRNTAAENANSRR